VGRVGVGRGERACVACHARLRSPRARRASAKTPSASRRSRAIASGSRAISAHLLGRVDQPDRPSVAVVAIGPTSSSVGPRRRVRLGCHRLWPPQVVAVDAHAGDAEDPARPAMSPGRRGPSA
jgi:hypothetical protein